MYVFGLELKLSIYILIAKFSYAREDEFTSLSIWKSKLLKKIESEGFLKVVIVADYRGNLPRCRTLDLMQMIHDAKDIPLIALMDLGIVELIMAIL